MSDFKSRIQRLEAMSAAGDAGTIALLVRLCTRDGSMPAAEELEQATGRPIDPGLVRRAAVLATSMRDTVREMRAATDGTAREAPQP